MRTLSFALIMASVFFSSPASACDAHAAGAEPKPKPRAAQRPSSFVAGEVREVDLADGTITLAHGKIVSLGMQPMGSMVFKAGDAKSIANLKPGDKVEFRAVIAGDRPTLTQIRPAGKSKK
jgi:Cu(I)/Ag(I) efflux system periplasmic protein CusF